MNHRKQEERELVTSLALGLRAYSELGRHVALLKIRRDHGDNIHREVMRLLSARMRA